MQTLNGVDSKFRLAILVARRAKQLIGGARRKVDIKSENPLSVAMEEFRQGKIDFDVLSEEEPLFGAESENVGESFAVDEAELEEEKTEDESDINNEDGEKTEEVPESDS